MQGLQESQSIIRNGNYSLSNEGFRGMGFIKEKQYDFSIMVRTEKPTNIKIKIQLLNYAGKDIGRRGNRKFQ